MGNIFKIVFKLIFLSLLIAHIVMFGFFLIPMSKLLDMSFEIPIKSIEADDIPKNIQIFLIDNEVEIASDFIATTSLKSRLIASILEVRSNNIENDVNRLAMQLNMLHFGENIVGIEAASEYYFKKPVAEISEWQWVTLINFQKIFAN